MSKYIEGNQSNIEKKFPYNLRKHHNFDVITLKKNRKRAEPGGCVLPTYFLNLEQVKK